MSTALTLDRLVGAIEAVHTQLNRQARAAVNARLTMRNWLIGAYLVEYEQAGADRARYGARLLEHVAERLSALPRTSARKLRRFRAFYLASPQIRETLSPGFVNQLPAPLRETEGDAPPIGLLLCTEKDQTVVKYALAGMSNQLFVSRYQVALPSEAEIEGMLAEVLA